jgi:hypothetical protein
MTTLIRQSPIFPSCTRILYNSIVENTTVETDTITTSCHRQKDSKDRKTKTPFQRWFDSCEFNPE